MPPRVIGFAPVLAWVGRRLDYHPDPVTMRATTTVGGVSSDGSRATECAGPPAKKGRVADYRPKNHRIAKSRDDLIFSDPAAGSAPRCCRRCPSVARR